MKPIEIVFHNTDVIKVKLKTTSVKSNNPSKIRLPAIAS